MPNAAARDPHTLVFSKDERYIWFTVQNGNFVGRLTLADRTTDLISVPTLRARPYGIKIAPDGVPWIVLLGTNKLASVNPQTLALTEYEIPAGGARPRRLETTSDGRVWYADYGRGYLGLPNGGTITSGPAAPGHCTGWRAKARLADTFAPGRYAPSVVGTLYRLSAVPT